MRGKNGAVWRFFRIKRFVIFEIQILAEKTLFLKKCVSRGKQA